MYTQSDRAKNVCLVPERLNFIKKLGMKKLYGSG